ncbi:hypothetical protein [Streptomyces sp. NPDC052015]|uniref:hypothetical protein n=1 Tax=Streptomyces sp. NPDC052015 TaxID=3154755 RepID=UPI00342F3B70
MPVTRRRYEDLRTAYAAMKIRTRKAEAKVANYEATSRAADKSAADTITRLSGEAAALRRIVAHQIGELEQAGLTGQAYDLRQRVAAANIDLTTELSHEVPARPAGHRHTAAESRLVAEIDRTRKAAGAFEDQCLDLQRINEAQARELRELREFRAAVEGSAA